MNLFEENMTDQAIALFGETRNPLECGYLLPDGKMLDLSGKHYMGDYVRNERNQNIVKRGTDYQANLRHVDHRELEDIVEEGGGKGMLEFMSVTGAIRVMPPIGFTLVKKPTPKQVAMMCVMAEFYGDGVYLEIYDSEGETIDSADFLTLRPVDIVKFISKSFP